MGTLTKPRGDVIPEVVAVPAELQFEIRGWLSWKFLPLKLFFTYGTPNFPNSRFHVTIPWVSATCTRF
jgi:hypothetical protein